MSSAVKYYDVQEHCVNKVYKKPAPPIPKDGEEFLERLKSDFKMRILEHEDKHHLVFEIIGIDVSLANALRRIMIAEVPTMAIEHVYMWNNSGIIHDEVLAHRVGLVPINVDPRMFEDFLEGADATDKNTLVFRLNVSCGKKLSDESKNDSMNISNEQVQSTSGNPEADTAAQEASSAYLATRSTTEVPHRPHTKHVYSGDLEWMPQGNQQQRYPNGIRPVHEDILLSKLRPGQQIELEAHARKSNGKDHAKYSPVATASYRLMPNVELLHDVYDELADELDMVEPGVFDIVPCDENGHTRKAKVTNPYACTMSRNFMRNKKLKEAVQITRVPDHFIFSIESLGMLPAATILAESIRVLKAKAEAVVSLCHEYIEHENLED